MSSLICSSAGVSPNRFRFTDNLSKLTRDQLNAVLWTLAAVDSLFRCITMNLVNDSVHKARSLFEGVRNIRSPLLQLRDVRCMRVACVLMRRLWLLDCLHKPMPWYGRCKAFDRAMHWRCQWRCDDTAMHPFEAGVAYCRFLRNAAGPICWMSRCCLQTSPRCCAVECSWRRELPRNRMTSPNWNTCTRWEGGGGEETEGVILTRQFSSRLSPGCRFKLTTVNVSLIALLTDRWTMRRETRVRCWPDRFGSAGHVTPESGARRSWEVRVLTFCISSTRGRLRASEEVRMIDTVPFAEYPMSKFTAVHAIDSICSRYL